MRRMGKANFFDLQDGAGRIQVFAQRDKLPEASWEVLRDTDLGDFLGAEGTMFRTRAGEEQRAADEHARRARDAGEEARQAEAVAQEKRQSAAAQSERAREIDPDA